ncbi:MAG: cadmium-containing carbonic anhydrase [Candidatus Gottesmanbacteria bacterium]
MLQERDKQEYQKYFNLLTELGFTKVEVISNDSGLTELVFATTEVACIDGRNAFRIKGLKGGEVSKAKYGPKFPGALLGLAALKYPTENLEDALITIAELVRQKGYIPTLHGDEHHENHNEIGCAAWNRFFPSLSLETGKKILQKIGGKYRILTGEHQEETLDINFRRGKTPTQNGRNFACDIWFAQELGIDPLEAVKFTAKVVRGAKPDVVNARILI